MTINLNNCGYSIANAVGHTLKRPLVYMVFKTAQGVFENHCLAFRVSKVAFYCFATLLVIIPLAVAWWVGKAIMCFAGRQLNTNNLHLAPSPIEIPEGRPEDCNYGYLYQEFDRLFPHRHEDLKNHLRRFCGAMGGDAQSIAFLGLAAKELFTTQLAWALASIIECIQEPEFPEAKKERILLQFAESLEKCHPTWLEVAESISKDLKRSSESNGDVEERLLSYIQKYKELLILECAQERFNFGWHALSFVRELLGEELGLDTRLNGFDPYARVEDVILGKVVTKWMFLQYYENTNRLVAAIEALINEEEYSTVYYDALTDVVKEINNIDDNDATDYVAEHCYSEDLCKINRTGVSILLKSIGILRGF